MATAQFKNNAHSTLDGAITSTATSLDVQAGDGALFPVINDGGTGSDYCMLTLVDSSGNREIVKVTRRDTGSDTMTITRAQESTSARAFADSDVVSHRLTAGVLEEIIDGSNLDGDVLDIDWNPSNYTPATTPAEASDVDDLTAHLYGIDQEIATLTTALAALSDIPSSETILFYKDTAVTGYTLVTSVDDKMVFVTKGSGAGGQTGGAAHSTGTWTQPNHTHTYSDVVNHTHTYWAPYGGGSNYGGSIGALTRDIVAATSNPTGGVAQGTTDGGATANTWRPASYCFTMQTRN